MRILNRKYLLYLLILQYILFQFFVLFFFLLIITTNIHITSLNLFSFQRFERAKEQSGIFFLIASLVYHYFLHFSQRNDAKLFQFLLRSNPLYYLCSVSPVKFPMFFWNFNFSSCQSLEVFSDQDVVIDRHQHVRYF